MTSVYVVEWGYHSLDNEGPELEAIFSTEDLAKVYVMAEVARLGLDKPGKNNDSKRGSFSDYDRYISYREVVLNEPFG